MLILSDKLLLDVQLNHTFMPNMIHKPWMVSITGVSGGVSLSAISVDLLGGVWDEVSIESFKIMIIILINKLLTSTILS